MKYFLILLVSILVIQESVAPPVTKDEKDENEVEVKEESSFDLEYSKYLQEVVQALESDPDFRKKLESTNEEDIKSGKIADELTFVEHNVRTKLDELKRIELERLRHLAVREFELENGLDPSHLKIAEHVDHENPHTFEIDDLKKLISKTTKDLDEADQKRREQFKEYEMHKQLEKEEKMKGKGMSEEEKTKFENEIHEMEKKHKDHEPLHHPGSKKQLEEVWEKQDHMENQQFNPKTFFYMHDLDGNGVWDQDELKALFLKELDKLYADGHPEDDRVERAEELERMREHVIKEVDLNKDGLISYEEFLNETKKAQFEQDPGWKPLDEQQIYSEQEYEAYRRAQEIEQGVARGMSQEYHPGGQPQAGHEQFPHHPNQIPQGHMQQPPQYGHPVPGQQQYPPQGQYQGHPQQGQYQGHPQQGQYNQPPPHHMNQIPQDHMQQPPQYGHPPAGQQHYPPQDQYNQMPHPGQYQGHPQQGQYPPAQQGQYNPPSHQQGQGGNPVPPQQQQYHPNDIPVHNNVNQAPVGQNPVPQQQQPLVPQQQQPPVPQQQQHPAVPNVNNAPQPNAPTDQQQYQPSADAAAHPANQQLPASTGQNQQNTQNNQVPQQAHHEQNAPANSPQTHQNAPNAPAA